MASNSAPTVDRIRIIPRPDDFLDRNFGNSGEVFFDKETKTLRLFDGKLQGGYSVVTDENITKLLETTGVSTVTNVVTVVSAQGSDVGNKYVINGVYKPALNFVIGYTYIFNQDDQTNEFYPNAENTTPNIHPLNFSADDPNGSLGAGTSYLTGVVYKLGDTVVTQEEYWSGFVAATKRSVAITVTSNTPTTLYYWCKNHLNMGNTITVAQPGTGAGGSNIDVSDSAPSSPQNGNIWYNSANGKLYVYVEDTDSNQWVQPAMPIPAANYFNAVTTGDSSQIYAVGESTLNFAAGPGIDITTDSANTVQISASNTAGDSIGNFTLADSIIDTDDSSEITVTPSLKLSSDLTVENDVTVINKVSAAEFVTTSPGNPVFDSASTITLKAPDGVLIEGELKLQTNNITGIGTLNGLKPPIYTALVVGTGVPLTINGSGVSLSTFSDNGNGDYTLTFSNPLGVDTNSFGIIGNAQDQSGAAIVTFEKISTTSIRVYVHNDAGTNIDADVFIRIYEI